MTASFFCLVIFGRWFLVDATTVWIRVDRLDCDQCSSTFHWPHTPSHHRSEQITQPYFSHPLKDKHLNSRQYRPCISCILLEIIRDSCRLQLYGILVDYHDLGFVWRGLWVWSVSLVHWYSCHCGQYLTPRVLSTPYLPPPWWWLDYDVTVSWWRVCDGFVSVDLHSRIAHPFSSVEWNYTSLFHWWLMTEDFSSQCYKPDHKFRPHDPLAQCLKSIVEIH